MRNRRRSIEITGFSHGQQPIPAASRVGGLVMSGGIYGLDPQTGSLPNDGGEQVRLMFWQLERILDAAGAGFDDILRMTFYIKDDAVRESVNQHWVARFPNAASRPARHTLAYDKLPANMLVQCDFLANVDD